MFSKQAIEYLIQWAIKKGRIINKLSFTVTVTNFEIIAYN